MSTSTKVWSIKRIMEALANIYSKITILIQSQGLEWILIRQWLTELYLLQSKVFEADRNLFANYGYQLLEIPSHQAENFALVIQDPKAYVSHWFEWFIFPFASYQAESLRSSNNSWNCYAECCRNNVSPMLHWLCVMHALYIDCCRFDSFSRLLTTSNCSWARPFANACKFALRMACG